MGVSSLSDLPAIDITYCTNVSHIKNLFATNHSHCILILNWATSSSTYAWTSDRLARGCSLTHLDTLRMASVRARSRAASEDDAEEKRVLK